MRGLILGGLKVIVIAVSLFALSLFVPRSPEFSSQTFTTPSASVASASSPVAIHPRNSNPNDIQGSKNNTTLQNRATFWLAHITPTHNVEGPHKYLTEGTNQKLRPNAMTGERVPTVDTLRNFFLMPTTEMLMLFQTVREVVL